MNFGNSVSWALFAFGKDRRRGEFGFSLIELLIVLAIIGILASQVVSGWKSPEPKLKTAAFNLRGNINLARAEAVKRNVDVRIDFIFDVDMDGDGDTDDGYRLWIDDYPAGSPDGVYTYDPDPLLSDTLIKEVGIRDEVEFYAQDVPAPTGPDKDISGATWGTSAASVDGVTFLGEKLTMQPDGTIISAAGGTVYLYAPNRQVLAVTPNAPEVIEAGPIAVTVSNTGRVKLRRWRSYEGANGKWMSK